MSSSPRRKKPVVATIATVASRANVAPMTVSRVINGGYASPEVRARVERAIKESGYTPSSTARSLRYGRKGCIGVMVESVYGAWFMGVLGGIEEELTRHHIGLMLTSLKPKDRYDSSAVSAWIEGKRVDGIISARLTKQEQPLLDAAIEADIPVTFICPDHSVDVGYSVRCRNFEAGKLIGAHLLELGHRRLGYVGGPKESIDSRERLRGLQEAVSAMPGARLRAEDIAFQSSYRPEAGAAAGRAYLKLAAGRRPSAIVLGNDSMAIAFICEMLRAGVRVPADVSVAGFDGIEEGERCFPTLTTVAQPMHRLGMAACSALLERIKDPTQDQASAEFPMLLLSRESTGPYEGSVPRRAQKRG